MAVIPTTFLVPPEPAIANFSFIEFASGKGVVEFFAGDTVDQQILSTATFYSEDSATATNQTNDANTVEFTTKFERTVQIEGTAIVNIPTRLSNNDADASIITCVYTIKLIKRTGLGDTELLSEEQTDVTPSITASNQDEYETLSVSADITRITLNQGDELVLQVLGTLSHTNGGNVPDGDVFWSIHHDPKDRNVDTAGGQDTTQTTIKVPFRIIS